MKLPDEIKDGTQIYYWRVDNIAEGLTHHRVTYIVNRPCHEVTGCAVGCGVAYVNEWYHEMRYVPNEPYWRGTGRSETDDIAAMLLESSEGIFETFEAARAMLIVRLNARSDSKRREADRLMRLRDQFPTEAPP